MTDAPPEQYVELLAGDPKLAGPVLERLVPAAAARAGLAVDRVVNALTAVDALVDAADRVLPGRSRDLRVGIGSGRISLQLGGLLDGEAESVRDAAALPEFGDVLKRTAIGVSVERNGEHSALVIALD